MNRTSAQKLEASGKTLMVQCSATTSSDVMFLFKFFWPHPPEHLQPTLPALEAWGFKHWTSREVVILGIFKQKLVEHILGILLKIIIR